ncbi:MAG: helix-turn-helix domain-containing protein [Xanthomonadaceae bacterium]|nr:helix-turn-helix domain-containing protein [Xanthomonadaceae bacterium]
MTSLETGMPETVRGIGERLRQARVRAGITPAEAGAKLKMPTHVIEALEREDWSKIGAPVFVRGHLRSYAKLLGLPADAIAANVAVPAAKAAELVPRTYTPRMQRVAEQAGRRLVYVLITATIAVPVWLATRSHLDGGANDAVSLDGGAAVTLPKAVDTSAAGDATQVRAQPEPLVASIAPLPQRGSAMAAAGDLAVTFSGESWVRVTAPDGSIIEQALVQPGQQRVFKPGQLGQAVLGNAQAISVQYQGRPVDLAPYIRANVARFTVSSDGSLQPVDR